VMRSDEVAIIGAGPAGIATAIQLRRYGLQVTVFEKNRIGGLLRSANLVENYPGFPQGISGPNLVRLFEEQLRNSAAEILFEEVVSLCFEDERFVVTTNERTLYPEIVVIASGTRPIELSDLELPPQFREAVCYDISSILCEKGKRIVIVGAGDAAFDYALNLGASNEVIIVNRGEAVSCIPLLWQRACDTAAISYFDNTRVLRIACLHSNQICIECMRQGELMTLQAHHLVSAIGREPQLSFLPEGGRASLDRLAQEGLISFVGDVRNGSFRQTAIAVGDGIMAAMKIGAKLSIPECERVTKQ
jgi:thioredoxin reductase (NADPH)